jgi:hypothetical protein
LILSDLEMEVRRTQKKGSRMRGEGQHLTETIASVFFLSGFKKRISKVSPSIGILRIPLEDYSECGDRLLDILFFFSCKLIPSAPYERRIVAEKELAKNPVDLFIALPNGLRERANQTVSGQDCPEGKCQCSQIGTLILQLIFSEE